MLRPISAIIIHMHIGTFAFGFNTLKTIRIVASFNQMVEDRTKQNVDELNSVWQVHDSYKQVFVNEQALTH